MVNTKTLNKYKCIRASFMSFVHNRAVGSEYSCDHVHAMVVLLGAITPKDVSRYLNMKAFGTTEPAGDANPISARANSLAMDKKAISFFMPNRDTWSMTRSEGNPTRSALVNALIKRVKKKEARKQGVDSQTRRPMLGQEFVAMHDLLNRNVLSAGRRSNNAHDVFWKRYGILAMTNFQFHLIARVDDSTQLVLEHIRVHDTFASALKTRLNWSKNMDDEQDAPWQIVLGSLNPVYCVLCSLALWLELNLKLNPTAMNSPREEFRGEQQGAERGGDEVSMLGIHSIRKYAATFAQRCGVTKDEKDIRGQWKGSGRVSDVYDDVELPYPDAKVAEKLCGGGPCFYVSDPALDATMMNTFVLSHVVPNIRKRLPDSACLVLGKALLWLICSPVADEYIPNDFKRDVLLEWEHVCGADYDAELNPIKKMAVTVSGDHGEVFIDMVGTIEVDGVAGQEHGGVPGTNNVAIRNRLLGMQSGLLSLRQDNLELKTAINIIKMNLERCFGILNGNMRRIALQPARRRTAGGGRGDDEGAAEVPERAAANDLAMMATLMPTPRSLHDLWQEYHHGVGGRKAARLFSYSERGRSKHRYHRQKVVWDLVGRLIWQGDTAETAIDKIYAVYGGQTSVTNIINGLKRIRRMGL
ncbi:hypothetical protein MHU86_2736 [Fragilaria crotonensis]|nr:hypothetical protein MHU86_2736 [Fragilaria crotonensis]